MVKKVKRSKITAIIICASVLVVAVGLGINVYKYLEAKKVITFSKEEITRAYITSGNTGEITELTGYNLELIYNDFKDITMKRIKNIDSTGWNYSVDFLVNNNTTRITIISATEWIFSGNRYKVFIEEGEKIFNDIAQIAN